LTTSDELAVVSFDRRELEDVLFALVDNARDAMPDGGNIHIETKSLDGSSGVMSCVSPVVRQRACVVVSVTDTGHGMDEHTVSHLFEPYFTTKKGRMGMSLSLAYTIVTYGGGEIEVESVPGHGSTFRVYLPQPGVTETILVVEDDISLRGHVAQWLRTHGYAVLEAANSEEALALCERLSIPIHLLLADVIMPRGGGSELSRQLTSLRPRLKTLYMSGFLGLSLQDHKLLEPGAPFVQKPFSMEDLVDAVREVLGSK
jgi:CheY-like chemotaxis protein